MIDLKLLTEKEIVGLTLWGEGRNQPIEGLVAIGNVLRNRLRNGRWGREYHTVCLAPRQFSCWNDSTDMNHLALIDRANAILKAEANTDSGVAECMFVGGGIVSHTLYRDNTAGSMWYVTKQLFHNSPPRWCEGLTPAAIVGDHVFFNKTN